MFFVCRHVHTLGCMSCASSVRENGLLMKGGFHSLPYEFVLSFLWVLRCWTIIQSLFYCRCVSNFSLPYSVEWKTACLLLGRSQILFWFVCNFFVLMRPLWFSFLLSLFIYLLYYLCILFVCRDIPACLCSEGVRNAFRRGLSSGLVTWFLIGLDIIVFH